MLSFYHLMLGSAVRMGDAVLTSYQVIMLIVDEIEFMSRAGRDGQEAMEQPHPSQPMMATAPAQPPMPDLYDEDIPF